MRVYLPLADASWMPTTSRSSRAICLATTGRRVVQGRSSFEDRILAYPLATRTLKLPTRSLSWPSLPMRNLVSLDLSDSPKGVLTYALTMPKLLAGVVAVKVVGEVTSTSLASVLPNRTVVPSTKSVPVIVTLVPPLELPWVGEISVTVGGAT